MSTTSIKINQISKSFQIGSASQKTVSLKQSVLSGMTSLLGKSQTKKYELLWALQDISFEVNKGEVVSIIGNNGAGKSTLLKIIAHVMGPSSGTIELSGKVSSLLGVGTGFHPELTGRENIFFNAAILGMPRAEVKKKLDQIVFFSGLKKFLDTPIKYYSNGMKVRLGFSVAAHLEPEILLLDEVLMVGDEAFKKRSIAKIKEIAQSNGCSVLFASHNMGAVREVCTKGVYLEKGKVKHIGEINELVEDYKGHAYEEVEKIKLQETIQQTGTRQASTKQEAFSFVVEDTDGKGKYDQPYRKWTIKNAPSTEHIRLLEVSVFKPGKTPDESIVLGEGFEVSIRYQKRLDQGNIEATLQFVSGLGEIFLISSAAFSEPPKDAMSEGIYQSTCKVPPNLLNSGRFYLDLLFHQNREKRAVFRMNRVLLFNIEPPEMEFGNKYRRTTGPVRPILEWSTQPEKE